MLLPLILAAMMATGCAGRLKTAGPEPEVSEAIISNAVSGPVKISELKGFGEITMVKSGQKLSGKFDALRKNSGTFNAQVYSPFGSAVASITANDFKGRADINREQFDFTFDDTMEGIPFPCAKYFTYESFAKVLTASMPNEFWALPAAPDTLIHSKKRSKKGHKMVTAAWVSDTLTIRALLVPKTGLLESVAFNYAVDGKKLTMQFGRFKRGVPYEILVRENSKNYISVNYETITWK